MSSSIKIFRSFLVYNPDGSIDASQIHSRDLYEKWLLSRRSTHSALEAKRFQRALSNHISGVDGRIPFSAKEEKAVLLVLRRKERWPCFPTDMDAGQTGFRTVGFHEKQQGAISRYSRSIPSNSLKHSKRIKRMEANMQEESSRIIQEDPTEGECDANNSVVMEEEEVSLEGMNESDASYVRRLGENFKLSYQALAPLLNPLDIWKRTHEMFRFILFGRTDLVQHSLVSRPDRAKILKDSFALEFPPHVTILVLDMAASNFKDKILAQNAASIRIFGDLVGNHTYSTVLPPDWFRAVLAVGRALHKPGEIVTLPTITLRCRDGVQKPFTSLKYFVDPKSWLMVGIAEPVE